MSQGAKFIYYENDGAKLRARGKVAPLKVEVIKLGSKLFLCSHRSSDERHQFGPRTQRELRQRGRPR